MLTRGRLSVTAADSGVRIGLALEPSFESDFMRVAVVLVLLAGLNSTIGNLLLKQSRINVRVGTQWYEKFLSLYFIGAIIFYVINLGLFTMALDDIPVSIGYPILAASGFAMLAIGAYIFFGERFGPWQITGLLLVLAGIFALAQRK